jgi:hypothetical protein
MAIGRHFSWVFAAALLLFLPALCHADPDELTREYTSSVRPIIQKYCLTCHATKIVKGDLDLERFVSLAEARKDLHAWQNVAEMLQSGLMPPKKAAQPKAEERRALLAFVQCFLQTEARSLAGDPGRVVVRRLSNAEYNNTVRDLTGIDLQPARDFPIDGAAGEGFTNVGDALAVSPTLLNRYLDVAKEIAAHVVLLPDGFRFSPSKTRRDWTNEALQHLRRIHSGYSPDGALPFKKYLPATIRYRDELLSGRIKIEEVATREGLNAKYLGVLWQALTDSKPSYPLKIIRAMWREADANGSEAIATVIYRWQGLLWRFEKIGSYRYGNTVRQLPNDKVDPVYFVGLDGTPEADLPKGFAGFRAVFPTEIFYGKITPDDEAVSLKLFHREDEPLKRLFTDDESYKRLDHAWEELRFISQAPVVENKQLPQFIGFMTADQPKELVAYFEGQRPAFRKRAEQFEAEAEAAAKKQLAALVDFAALAYRRPLVEKEKSDLLEQYAALRKKGSPKEGAFRTVLTRILISPYFLLRIERAQPGTEAQPVSVWELATRLSYFLWATMPDAELRRVAADGSLLESKILSAQVARMLKDAKVRGLATEFATQWLHVRDLQQNREKNEKLFPTFDDELRDALFEETVLFLQDIFQSDRPIHDLLDADDTFLNESLARHYGIPDVDGPMWRKVSGVKKYGRGGILTLGSVLTKQSGASRTSPVLRGNWLVEVMLGEKLPKPPPDVPRLPEEEAGTEETIRQLVEKHVQLAECAVCHQRIDPFGFALEQYDPIGRFRDQDLAGRAIDSKAKLTDGTEFEGAGGLGQYLLTQRGEDVRRHFCRKLLGYALGRSIALSDLPLIEQMQEGLKKNGDRISLAVQTIANSRPFRYHRGLDATKDE